ncbi:hypothetical protein TRICI_003032 [Trichomonascus ciferrii]|uniref:Cyclin-D1-binding protein 1-like N-terminal domain-containing protein n=1 Tax=Trichomonascus ciferrii TaxID=44093 RepID=A0A642VB78_9ASCO|nr:hypothetical protein TRICI_003032 [Trichomonascus ciferrii]
MSTAEELERKLDSFFEMVEQIKKNIYKPSAVESERVDRPLNAIGDIGSLWHAHTTKIAITFKPPVAIKAACQCIEDCSNLVAPLAAAYMGMSDEKDGVLIRQETRSRIYDLLSVQLQFVKELKAVPKDQDSEKSGSSNSTLVSVGEVWEMCNKLKELPKLSLAKLVQAKLSEYSKMIQDGLQDLKDWLEDPDAADFDFGDENSDSEEDNEHNDTNETTTNEDTIKLGERWADKLVKLEFLYRSISKRRCTLLSTETLNTIYTQVDELSGLIDDLVCSFLDKNDCSEIQELSDTVDTKVKSIVDLVILKNQDDQFVKWVDLFNKNFYS